ncbi:MAG TPA: fused MFS/spermidine synthase, partial [Polyangiaceae bacterium]|nr:fused MFS/spermidine synthase [Polyangiaceae bacterium]
MPEAKTPSSASASGKGIAAFLFVSGMCALIYQVVWMRELRLVFGASTPATAAVLAVFMGGLGVGSHLLGKRADRVKRPFNMYATLEGGIAISAALTPFFLMGARAIYVALGGSQTLGPAFGTIVRLLLSAIVLLPPTLLMGGTLPAAARAATHASDIGRVRTALLYGTNTLGAVTGAALSTFVMLEIFGTRFSLWIAATVNLLLAVLARVYDRRLAEAAPTTEVLDAEVIEDKDEKQAPPASKAPTPFVLTAAAGVGLVFLLMELVWYRMLAPLLGGSSYTFGLILAVALLGIGIGGFLYTMRSAVRPADLRGFALSCGLEALFIGLPFALGDRVALMALFLRPTGVMGLWGHVLSWTLVTGVVVLPAAIVAGYQFPLLIALLGRARQSVGQHVGLAYAFNTLGAIVGSLAGGVWLVPGLGCLGTWTLSVWILVVLGVAAIALDVRARSGYVRLLAPALAVLIAPALIHGAVGPTAVWRHSPIGAGRADEWLDGGTRNALRENMHERRRAITWEVDGRESTIGLYTLNDTAFLVNGKSDGAAVLDSGTQVMSGLLGAILHPGKIKHALVIG